jgi:hypothetical protein
MIDEKVFSDGVSGGGSGDNAASRLALRMGMRCVWENAILRTRDLASLVSIGEQLSWSGAQFAVVCHPASSLLSTLLDWAQLQKQLPQIRTDISPRSLWASLSESVDLMALFDSQRSFGNNWKHYLPSLSGIEIMCGSGLESKLVLVEYVNGSEETGCERRQFISSISFASQAENSNVGVLWSVTIYAVNLQSFLRHLVSHSQLARHLGYGDFECVYNKGYATEIRDIIKTDLNQTTTLKDAFYGAEVVQFYRNAGIRLYELEL